MRILQLHTRYRQAGGEDVVVHAEYEALRAAGHQVHQHIEENPERAVGAAVALAGSLWNIRSAARVAATADRFAPDFAHVHNTWFAASPSILAPLRARRVPVVMTIHNYRLMCANSLFLRDAAPCEKCVELSPWQAVRHRCYRNSRALSAVAATGIAVHRTLETWPRHVDRFIVLSEFARERLTRAGLPAERLRLGANFVADPGPRPASPADSSTVLFIGRISEEKGLGVLLEAWRRGAPGRFRLEVVGDGPARARLEAGAPAGVTFLGRRTPAQVMDRLQRARALVLPSIWYEGQPVTALEGLAAGTPLVLSAIGGLPEVLGADGVKAGTAGGWTVRPGDPAALAAALGRLAEDTDVDVRGRAARARFLERFTPAAAVTRMESVYAEAREACAA